MLTCDFHGFLFGVVMGMRDDRRTRAKAVVNRTNRAASEDRFVWRWLSIFSTLETSRWREAEDDASRIANCRGDKHARCHEKPSGPISSIDSSSVGEHSRGQHCQSPTQSGRRIKNVTLLPDFYRFL
jgi:hypothetical protein